MKLVCIDNEGYDFTIGKIYETDGPLISHEDIVGYVLKSDSGLYGLYSSTRFITIDESRDLKINSII